MITHKLAIFRHFLSWFLSFFSYAAQILPCPAPCRQTVLPSPPPALSNELLTKKFLSQLFFSQILSKGYRSFWSTSKRCWQGHNWTFFPVQHRCYRRDDYPSWPYYSLPLATTSYPSPFGSYPTCSSGSSPFLPLLTFSKASPRTTTCSPHPKKPFLHFGSNPFAAEDSVPSTGNVPTAPRWAPCTGSLPLSLVPRSQALLLLRESASRLAIGSWHRWKSTHFIF